VEVVKSVVQDFVQRLLSLLIRHINVKQLKIVESANFVSIINVCHVLYSVVVPIAIVVAKTENVVMVIVNNVVAIVIAGAVLVLMENVNRAN
jgi:hypothetical protein